MNYYDFIDNCIEDCMQSIILAKKALSEINKFSEFEREIVRKHFINSIEIEQVALKEYQMLKNVKIFAIKEI